MRLLQFLFIGALTAGFFATEARADDAATEADIQCLVVGLRMASMTDPTVKTAALPTALYYFGKLDGRDPNLDLETKVIELVEKMTDDEFRTYARRCGAELQNRGAKITEMGDDIIRKAKGTDQKQSTAP